MDTKESVKCVAFSPDGTQILVRLMGLALYSRWNTLTGKLVGDPITGHK